MTNTENEQRANFASTIEDGSTTKIESDIKAKTRSDKKEPPAEKKEILSVPVGPMKLTAEKITAIMAVILSVIAIFISLWQGSELMEHNRNSVRPYLQLDTTSSLNKGEKAAVLLSNEGLGPAIIKKVLVYVNDKKIYGAPNLVRNVINELDLGFLSFKGETFRKDDAIRAGDTIVLFGLIEETDIKKLSKSDWDNVVDGFKKLRIRIEYQDMYYNNYSTEIENIQLPRYK